MDRSDALHYSASLTGENFMNREDGSDKSPVLIELNVVRPDSCDSGELENLKRELSEIAPTNLNLLRRPMAYEPAILQILLHWAGDLPNALLTHLVIVQALKGLKGLRKKEGNSRITIRAEGIGIDIRGLNDDNLETAKKRFERIDVFLKTSDNVSHISVPLIDYADGPDSGWAERHPEAVDDVEFRYWGIGTDGSEVPERIYDSKEEKFLDDA